MNFVSMIDFAQCIGQLDGIVKGVISKSVVDSPILVQGKETKSIGIVSANWLKNYPAEKRNASIEQFAREGLDKKKPIKPEAHQV